MKIGIYLRKYRIDKGYSQEYLADVLGVSQKTYSNMENDKSNISLKTMKKLIDFYGIDLKSIDVSKFMQEGKLEQNFHKSDQATANGIMINPISEKLIHQMEERIEELKNQVSTLQAQLIKYKKL